MSTMTEIGKRVAAGRLGISLAEYVAQVEAGNRWCSRHRGWSPIENFQTNRGSPTGYHGYCRACRSVYASENRQTVTTGGVTTVYGGAR